MNPLEHDDEASPVQVTVKHRVRTNNITTDGSIITMCGLKIIRQLQIVYYNWVPGVTCENCLALKPRKKKP